MFGDVPYRTGALVKHNLILRLRDPGQLISYLVTPMVLMVLLKPLYTRAYSDTRNGGVVQAVTGQMVMFSVFAMAIVGNSIFIEREWRTWDRLRASRATRGELLVGKSLPVYGVLMLQQIVLIYYGCLVVGMPAPKSVALLVLAVAVWGFALMAMGSALATLVRSRGDLMMASDVGSIAVSALGGALLPVGLMPGWARDIAPFSPGYWGLRVIQAAVDGQTGETARAALVCLLIGLATGAVAAYRLARGWGRSRLA
ncbi:ABC transporter permease [Catenulispora rubra]|uniref:ABC transporter permease n=1 Tax=Catenulispora rubra TaxID=280293 RepID=UPI0018923B89|nr:ABC transporter permease [Catenulispora rubra]